MFCQLTIIGKISSSHTCPLALIKPTWKFHAPYLQQVYLFRRDLSAQLPPPQFRSFVCCIFQTRLGMTRKWFSPGCCRGVGGPTVTHIRATTRDRSESGLEMRTLKKNTAVPLGCVLFCARWLRLVFSCGSGWKVWGLGAGASGEGKEGKDRGWGRTGNGECHRLEDWGFGPAGRLRQN